MARRSRLAGAALLLLVAGVAGATGCRVDYECADACGKVYSECGSSVEVEGIALEREQCQLVCEEGMASPRSGAQLWLDCVEDSVCPGDSADGEDRDLHRYDIDWCTPQFEILVLAG